MSTTGQHFGQTGHRSDEERSVRTGLQESARAWGLGDRGDRCDLAVIAFPFTSRSIPRASRSHCDEG